MSSGRLSHARRSPAPIRLRPLTVDAGRIVAVDAARNPDKLSGLAEQADLAR